MRGECIYLQVMVQMYLKGWDSRTLAEQAVFISYGAPLRWLLSVVVMEPRVQ